MLTSSQQQALDTSRHLSVTANAGSGKTMVLVERYINILTSGKAHVNEVVALTFTDKAASELRRKISDGIVNKIAEENNLARRQRLEAIRDQLSSAMIGTIHWFCKRLLQDHPVEAGVDASFTVVEGVDQVLMLEQAIKQTFHSILKEEPFTAKREELFTVLRAIGRPAVQAIVSQLAQRRELVQRWLSAEGIYSHSDDDVLARWRGHLSEVVGEQLDDSQLMHDLARIADSASGKGAIAISAKFKAIKLATKPSQRLQLLTEFFETVLTSNGTLRKAHFKGNAETELAEETQRTSTARKLLAPLTDFIVNGSDDGHRMLLSYSRLLLELYQIAIERYGEMKIEGALLDFDDLQIHAKELLRNEKVRRSLAQRFKFIMVDEYQDTNRLQYEILLPLVDQLSRGNLFIVGDPKQSIYGFRNADVAVFNQTKNDIERVAGKDSAVVLNDSFRLLRDIVAFVNFVFQPLMSNAASEHDVAYERLVRGRQNPSSGRVELLLREKSCDESEENRDEMSEGELLARRILQLKAQRYKIFEKDESSRPMQLRDIAILMRSRNGLAGIEEAFFRHNIPYHVTGGIGYFQTQAIYDFYNFFRFLLNTDDDVALVGVLRSPFFNVSDAALFEIVYGRRTRSLWDELRSGRGKAATFPSVVRAIHILKSDVEIATRIAIPDLVERIIHETGYTGFVAGSSRSAQIVANLEKLKRIARRYEEQGFKNLFDFVARLQKLIEEEEQEGQAAIDVFADTVKIMTIHAAKGLEFPVVIVPNLERSFQYDGEPHLDEELGMGFSLGDDVESPLSKFLKQRSHAKTIAEEKRIFYVACTRARDVLILSGALGGNRSTKTCMNWLLDSLAVEETIDAKEVSFEVETQWLDVREDMYVPRSEQHLLRVHVLRAQDVLLPVVADEAKPAIVAQPHLRIEPIMSQPRSEMFSASKIRTYVECPAKYYLRYVAGMPSPNIRFETRSLEAEKDVSIPADLRGSAFHHIMQHIDELPQDDATLRAALKEFIAQDSLSIISEPSIALDEIVSTVLDVVGSEFWRDVKRGADVRTEFTIMAALGNDFLTGTLDRIFRAGDGVWNILDYKTDAVDKSGVKAKARQYEAQVKFYSLLVQKFFSGEEVCATLLFTSALNSPVRFKFAKRELMEYERELTEIIRKINAREFRREGAACEGCPFAPRGCSEFLR